MDAFKDVSEKIGNIPREKRDEAAAPIKMQQIESIFDEYEDKQKRKANLVIHNLQEASGETHAERNQEDQRMFVRMVKDELKLNVRVAKSFRIGICYPSG